MQSDLDNLTTPVAGEIWLDIDSAGLLKHIQILIYGDLPARTVNDITVSGTCRPEPNPTMHACTSTLCIKKLMVCHCNEL